MKSTYQRRLPHIQKPGRPLFVTFTTWQRRILREDERAIVLEHCLRDHGVRLWMRACIVMPDHVHLLFTAMRDAAGDDYALAAIMKGMKGAAARSINRVRGANGRVWQDESYDHVLRASEGVRKTAEYMCRNPLRAGIATNEDDYPWLWREWVEGLAQ